MEREIQTKINRFAKLERKARVFRRGNQPVPRAIIEELAKLDEEIEQRYQQWKKK